jgi:hypothetical protein
MRVRNRAGLEQPPQGELMNSILEEYRHELAGEFSLWWVLRRSGDHIEYIQDRFDIAIPEGKDLMPIPQQQIDINPNLTQNPGY